MLWWQITLEILGCIAAMMPITQSLQDSRWDASDSGQREQISYRRAALAKAIVLSVLVGQVAVAALSDSDSKAASRERGAQTVELRINSRLEEAQVYQRQSNEAAVGYASFSADAVNSTLVLTMRSLKTASDHEAMLRVIDRADATREMIVASARMGVQGFTEAEAGLLQHCEELILVTRDGRETQVAHRARSDVRQELNNIKSRQIRDVLNKCDNGEQVLKADLIRTQLAVAHANYTCIAKLLSAWQEVRSLRYANLHATRWKATLGIEQIAKETNDPSILSLSQRERLDAIARRAKDQILASIAAEEAILGVDSIDVSPSGDWPEFRASAMRVAARSALLTDGLSPSDHEQANGLLAEVRDILVRNTGSPSAGDNPGEAKDLVRARLRTLRSLLSN